MSLDEQTKLLLALGENSPALHELSVADARLGLKDMTQEMDIDKIDVFKRTECTIPGPVGDIPARIYWPETAPEGKAFPVLVLYHGGGFALGDMDTHENVARYYCARGQVIVINVEYRLAPEHPFPAGVEDAYAALLWVSENASKIGGDASKIAVIGDSAGGNMCAVLCQKAKSAGGPAIARQILLYPSVDLRDDADYPSRQAYGQGYFLTENDMTWIKGMYFKNADEAKSPLASPILMTDLSGLPPALIITAGYDPLVDEGKAYADRLKEAKVDVDYMCFETTIHGFMSFAGTLDAGRKGLEQVVNYLKAMA